MPHLSDCLPLNGVGHVPPTRSPILKSLNHKTISTRLKIVYEFIAGNRAMSSIEVIDLAQRGCNRRLSVGLFPSLISFLPKKKKIEKRKKAKVFVRQIERVCSVGRKIRKFPSSAHSCKWGKNFV